MEGGEQMQEFDKEVISRLQAWVADLENSEEHIKKLANPDVKDENLVTFELALDSSNATSLILVDQSEYPENFDFGSLSSTSSLAYAQSYEQVIGKLLVVLDGELMSKYSIYGEAPLELCIGENGDLSLLQISDMEGESPDTIITHVQRDKQVTKMTTNQGNNIVVGEFLDRQFVQESGQLHILNNGDTLYTQLLETGDTMNKMQYTRSSIDTLQFLNSSVEGVVINHALVAYKNGDVFKGSLENNQMKEGTLKTVEGLDTTVEITSKFENGFPYGYATIVKPGYKFQGLLRAFEQSQSPNRGLIDAIYGHIEMKVVDSDTDEVSTQHYSGLFSTKQKISTPGYYESLNFLGNDSIFNLEEHDPKKVHFDYKKPDDYAIQTTHLSVKDLQENEQELMTQLDDHTFLRKNFLFATHQTEEYTFHGCMKDYNGQCFGLLYYPKLNQTFIGNFSPKMILEQEGIFFYSPEEVKKSQPGDEKERPDPPFRYTGGFKNSLFEGFGILDFSAGDQNLIFEGEFSEGKRHGFGVLRRDGDIVVEGDWVDDNFIEEEREKQKEKEGLQTSGSFEEFDRKVKESLNQQGKTQKEVDESEYVDRFDSLNNYSSLDINMINHNSTNTQVLNPNFPQNYFQIHQIIQINFRNRLYKLATPMNKLIWVSKPNCKWLLAGAASSYIANYFS